MLISQPNPVTKPCNKPVQNPADGPVCAPGGDHRAHPAARGHQHVRLRHLHLQVALRHDRKEAGGLSCNMLCDMLPFVFCCVNTQCARSVPQVLSIRTCIFMKGTALVCRAVATQHPTCSGAAAAACIRTARVPITAARHMLLTAPIFPLPLLLLLLPAAAAL